MKRKKDRFTLISKKMRGFTLIELIVVIAVIGILVLLALPLLLGHTQDAKAAKMVHNTKVVERSLETYLAGNNDELPFIGTSIAVEDIKDKVAKGKVYDSTGFISDETLIEDGNYVIADEEYIKSEAGADMPGDYVANENGKVFYIHTEAGGSNQPPQLTAEQLKTQEFIQYVRDNIVYEWAAETVTIFYDNTTDMFVAFIPDPAYPYAGNNWKYHVSNAGACYGACYVSPPWWMFDGAIWYKDGSMGVNYSYNTNTYMLPSRFTPIYADYDILGYDSINLTDGLRTPLGVVFDSNRDNLPELK